MGTTVEHAPLYEVRVPITPEIVAEVGSDIVTSAEETVRRRLRGELGPELADRAKLWWEIEEFHPDYTKPRPRWQPGGFLFPPHVKLLYCVMQVMQWWERNPLLYGFPDRQHDWPDFRCELCDVTHPPPMYFCPVCGDIFWHGDDVACGHSLEVGVPAPAPVRPVPRAALCVECGVNPVHRSGDTCPDCKKQEKKG